MSEKQPTRSYRNILYNTYVSKRHVSEGIAYDESNYQRWAVFARKRFQGWLPDNQDAVCLDLGCGHGNFLYLLEQAGYTNLVGVDLSKEQLQLALLRCPSATLIEDNIKSYLSNNKQLFDLIGCLNVIEHLSKEELFGFLDLLVKNLKPGGRVIFETPNAESPWFGAVAYGDLTHEWFFTPGSLADTLSQVGLIKYEARSTMQTDFSSVKRIIRTLVWGIIKYGCVLWNMTETGSKISGIYTRVFVATAVKPL
ncbi:MAG: class I SAM-dependent methyltransferase [Methylococcaceae bacterium]